MNTRTLLCVLVVLLLALPMNKTCAQETRDTVLSENELPLSPVVEPETSEVDSLLQEKRKLLQIINPSDSALIQAMKNFDILIKRDWQVSVVKVKNITDDQIEFLYPLNTEMQALPRDETSQILFANGKHEVFYPLEKKNPNDSINIANVLIADEKAWEKIIVVENADEIPGELVELKTIDARFDGDRVNTPNKMLEKSALIILRKKTVNAGGNYLLITDKRFNRPYGDFPYTVIEGKAFGESLKEE